MAGKESGSASRQTRKSTSTNTRKSSGTSRGKNTRKNTRKKQQRAFELSLRPEHQRELFALSLITIAVISLIFFVTGTTGGIGNVYVQGMERLFGVGALVVPLVLGSLGVAILVQERLRDTAFSGTSVLGIGFILAALLAMLEFPHADSALNTRAEKGGGLIGYWMVYALDSAIGRPAAVIVFLVLLLVGFLLTFNLTLRELWTGTAARLSGLLELAWGGSEPHPQRGQQATEADRPTRKKEADALVFESPPQPSDEDVFSTPIADRVTKASLFKRGQGKQAEPAPDTQHAPATESTAAPQPARQERPAEKQPAASSKKEEVEPAAPQPAQETHENVQETLDGFDLGPVHLAWPLPAFDLLDAVEVTGRRDEEVDRTIQAQSLVIEETLASFKVEAQVVGVNPGPAVTQFEVQPAVGVKISKITTLEKDLALALAASSIRIEAPVPGKSVVGIEIPNSAIATVNLREVIDSEEFDSNKGKLRLPLGKDIGGNPVVADMARMPHLLIAGSTGSGKSVAINAFLCGLLLKHTPESLKMILVDPKMVELIVYNHIPHLLSPVVTELERVVPTLKWATREMERRYKIFARHGCRNLESYKKMALRRADLEPMPYILIVIDELADLMMMAPDEIETYICRLAQMARATGIHLIIATQRPSVDVITGLIKANFPSRIAFAVTSQTDSRVILDVAGADHLLGRGDMLYMAADSARMVRIQGTYVSDREVEQIVTFWRDAKPPEPAAGKADNQPTATRQQAEYEARSRARAEQLRPAAASQEEQKEQADQQTRQETAAGNGAESNAAGSLAYTPPAAFLSTGEQDELLPQAMDLVKQHRRASASLLTRRLGIGYSKAAQLIDLLEQQGIVGPAEGGRSREVLQRESSDE